MPKQFFYLFALISTALAVAQQYPHTKIWKDLLENYDRKVNPVKDPSKAVNLALKIGIENVIELDFKRQLLSLKGWISMWWKDEFLVFNETEYNVKKLYASPEDIWLPDLVMLFSITDGFINPIGTKAIVKPDGSVIWVPPQSFNTLCPVKIEHFPFDTQICNISISSWYQANNELNLSVIDLGTFDQAVDSDQWDLTQQPCTLGHFYDDSYQIVTCQIVLKRKPLFYIFNLVAPCLLLVIVGSLTFILPVDSEEKISLSVTILLAMTVMSQVVMDSVPAVSNGVPFLGQFIMACSILLALATAMSVIIVKLSDKSGSFDKQESSEVKVLTGSTTWKNFAVLLDRTFLVLYILVVGILVIWLIVMTNKQK